MNFDKLQLTGGVGLIIMSIVGALVVSESVELARHWDVVKPFCFAGFFLGVAALFLQAWWPIPIVLALVGIGFGIAGFLNLQPQEAASVAPFGLMLAKA